ncbi:ImmA/IrrE family metallo-endopeptidase [Bacillus altitudinis]|uniref:ImmA/IrrE family metallo-endopeptidase n=1 Tax=Bacillus TaxID=1386 RepID=UPI000260AA18|nr:MULTISPECIES: ImmA/IrrE family metallo-endopeptidase [Bacillus]EIL83087.1 hypothetical protein BAME_38160 [Bacillus sp. M 2-6]MEC0471156.1 ImmA/IrrE family metallo-endopeptidase [Bacillus altitudinis]
MSKLTYEIKQKLSDEMSPVAAKYRKSFVGPNEPIKDTFGILEKLGFFIVKFPTNGDLSGFHIVKSGYNFIYINSAHSLGRQYFSAWHEYYHSISGENNISLTKDKTIDEYKADCFASHILLPDTLVLDYLKKQNILNLKYISYEQLIRMQNYFRVSYSALIVKLIRLFPENKDTLNQRASLGSIERKEEMRNYIEKYGGDISLSQQTNDFYVSTKFLTRLEKNHKEGRVSTEKFQEILRFLEELRVKYEHDS